MNKVKEKKCRQSRAALSNRDTEILKALYQLQSVRAIDIVDVYFTGYSYGMERLQRLVERGYMERNYTVTSQGRRNHAVLNITEKGLEELVKLNKISLEKARRARDLKLTGWDMVRRVEISKICLHLSRNGWQFIGSRDAKEDLDINPNSMMHCCLISPEGDIYQVYYVSRSIKHANLERLFMELSGNKYGNMVFYEADDPLEETDAYKDIMRGLNSHGARVNELCMIPLVELEADSQKVILAVSMLKNSGIEQARAYLKSRYGFVGEATGRYGFETMYTRINGKDYLVCNYLRRDKVALKMLAKNLTINEHINSGYGALVLTWQGYKNEVQEEIDRVQPGRDFIRIEGVLGKDIEAAVEEADSGQVECRADG